MIQFIRVRSAVGPAYEYDVSVDEYTAHPDAYAVVDDIPVDASRPTEYFLDTEETAPPAVAAKAAPEPSVGDIKEEGA